MDGITEIIVFTLWYETTNVTELIVLYALIVSTYAQQAITCSKLAIETLNENFWHFQNNLEFSNENFTVITKFP